MSKVEKHHVLFPNKLMILKRLWYFRKDIIAAVKSIDENCTVTPAIMGWHHYKFVGGKKPALYVDGEQYKEDLTIQFSMKYHPKGH